jgi:hypothetical protein
MAEDKLREVGEEFRAVVGGRANLLDSVLPPLVFVLLNAWLGFAVAAAGALALALAITGLRLWRGHSPAYALGGVGAVGLAVAAAWLLDRAAGFFLPNIVLGALTVVLSLVSVVVGRPLVAWTSHLARRWPRAWYWHPRVRPAYTEVTLAWTVFFALRLGLQLVLFRRQASGLLAVVQVLLGWPATIVLLVVSYLYGTWRLRQLGGPSVEEFKRKADPPWEGQQRGF